jgi:hypothetical protein
MVEFLEGRILSRYLLEKYSKAPAGWSFTIFPAKRGDSGYGALVGSSDEMWRIQLDSVYSSNPLMLGAKTEVDSELIPRSNMLSYGYRKLNERAVMAILKEIVGSQEEDASQTSSNPHHEDYQKPLMRGSSVLDRILSSLEPVSPKGVGTYAEGPIVLSSRKVLEPIVDKQQDLEDKLSAELRRLLKQKFSAYG